MVYDPQKEMVAGAETRNGFMKACLDSVIYLTWVRCTDILGTNLSNRNVHIIRHK